MNDLFQISLSVAVPLWIMELKDKGGPSEKDFSELPSIAQLLGEHGDQLLFKSKKKGETANLFNKTARAIAVLSFCPGGITVFNQHYESTR